jgi:MutS domain V
MELSERPALSEAVRLGALPQTHAMFVDSSSPQQDPHVEYSRKLEELRVRQSQYQHNHKLLGNTILVVALAAVIVAVWGLGTLAIFWALIPAFVFVFLAIVHERVLLALRRCSRVREFYERGLARLENHWIGTGETGERFLDPSHPYSRDLDLFGKGSLFELLCTVRTRAGEEILANWLLEPASSAEISARQAAISELRSRLDLREDMAVLGENVRLGVRPDKLVAWAEGEPFFQSEMERLAATVLPAFWLLSLVVWALWGLGYPALLTTLVNLGFSYRARERIKKVVPPVEEAARDLTLLSEVLARLEGETFSAAKLVRLQARLQIQGVVPSRSIARLNRLVEFLESRRNPFVKTLDPFLLWTLQLAFAVDAWRKKFGSAVRRWLAAVGEMEALLSLACYAYENPTDVFPEFTEDGPCFEAEAFAHPLIPQGRAVRNDLRLGRELQLMIISGPNMAGKSTFVRAVGTNAVLALCGAPARARRLRLSHLAVTASICILDSLQGGISRFYAEITRLKQIADLATGSPPVLFLLDELLQGTNSQDRRIGAEAVVRALLGRGAIGLVTTHDLALAQIAERLGTHAVNMHFEDRLENGQLLFDYRLSPEIVQTSNALELMRLIGLEV